MCARGLSGSFVDGCLEALGEGTACGSCFVEVCGEVFGDGGPRDADADWVPGECVYDACAVGAWYEYGVASVVVFCAVDVESGDSVWAERFTAVGRVECYYETSWWADGGAGLVECSVEVGPGGFCWVACGGSQQVKGELCLGD